ncbi:MAG: cupin domain-containing protein [Clostridia bacterium]|nr:cupin domain-containing protein [Clostridia bacterium]
MIEKVYEWSKSDGKVIEGVIRDENLHYMHMSLPVNEVLPVHTTNANVYMTVVTGQLSIALADGAPTNYPAGTVLKIPQGIVMDARNSGTEKLELVVVKAPPPKNQ